MQTDTYIKITSTRVNGKYIREEILSNQNNIGAKIHQFDWGETFNLLYPVLLLFQYLYKNNAKYV